jgi:hypothetical protein
MQRLQIKEEIMAVAALLALGMLTVLAGGLNANVAAITQPKAAVGTCMAIAYVAGRLDYPTTLFCIGVPSGLVAYFDTASKDWWQQQLGGRRLSVVLGERILNALRLARFASLAAGPIGFLVMTA